jgi:hypothetical protein
VNSVGWLEITISVFVVIPTLAGVLYVAFCDDDDFHDPMGGWQ